MSRWHGQTIAELSPLVARGEVTAVALTEQALAAIAAANPRLNAFITVTADDALAQAREADRERAAGRVRGALHGIPISLKDLVDLAGVRTSAGSQVRRDHVATADAPVTARLKAAGAVIVGKTNLHEFAFGTTTEDSGFGPARHPVDDTRSPGGSSGGSGIAVRTGMGLASVGTDTGGSIRIPAAVCGVVGLKPAWNELPADGVVPLSRGLDHVGPLARTVTDAWVMYEAMAGRATPVGASLDPQPLRGLRLGLLTGYFLDRMDAEVETVFHTAVDALRRAGAIVDEVTLPYAADMAPIYLHLVLADAAAYHGPTLDRRPQDYTPNVRMRLEMGRYVLGQDYVRATIGREAVAGAIDRLLEGRAGLVCPTLGIPAPPIGAATVPVRGGLEPVRTAMLRLTQPFNLGRQPAISVPCGETAAGLPVGLQIAGTRGHTHQLLRVARACESVLPGT
jgi:aspartyl-tRNA(Asn)/glutamyl-tRNA(Gln) amidotransferase subunit A